MDQLAREGVRVAACADAVEAADRQHGDGGAPRLGVQVDRLALQSREADAGDAAGHAGEVVGDERAREAERVECAREGGREIRTLGYVDGQRVGVPVTRRVEGDDRTTAGQAIEQGQQ